MSPEGSEEVAWNIAQQLTMEIQYQLVASNRNYMQGNIETAFHHLTVAKMNAIQSFTDKERKYFEKLESVIGIRLIALKKVQDNKGGNVEEHIKKSAERCLPTYFHYNTKLRDALDKHGYLIGKKQDASIMKFK